MNNLTIREFNERMRKEEDYDIQNTYADLKSIMNSKP
jgi:hypothetical protein